MAFLALLETYGSLSVHPHCGSHDQGHSVDFAIFFCLREVAYHEATERSEVCFVAAPGRIELPLTD